MIDDFYWPFHKNVDGNGAKGEHIKGRRDLGLTLLPVKYWFQLTRFGPVVQLGIKDEMKR